MRKPRAVAAAVVAASFLTQSCMSMQRMPVPEPDVRAGLDVRGVVLGDGPDSQTFEFSEVIDARWTETSLMLTGTVHAPGEPDHGQTTTASFPVADISELLVRELDGTRSSIILGGVIMGASIVITLLLTGKSQAGVPIGSTE